MFYIFITALIGKKRYMNILLYIYYNYWMRSNDMKDHMYGEYAKFSVHIFTTYIY